MKRKTLGLLVGLLLLGSLAHAADYTVTLTTYVPTASSADFTLGGYPNITGTVQMRGWFLANTSAVGDTISVYDTCTSSLTATLAMKVYVSSVTTWPTGAGQLFPARLFVLTSPCFTKGSTSSTIQSTVIYDTSN